MDANIAFRLGLAKGSFLHPKLTLLRGVTGLHGIPLVLTRTVAEEIVGQFTRDLDGHLSTVTAWAEDPTSVRPEKAEAARIALLNMVACWTNRPEFYRGEIGPLVPPLRDYALKTFRARLAQVFPTVWEKPAGAAEDAERREIERQLPAMPSGDGAGKGFRDTMIWLTLLANGAAVLTGNVYFLALDRGFGFPLHDELQLEATRRGMRQLVFYDDVDKLVDRLSSPVDELPEPVEVMLAHPVVRSQVRRLLADGNFRLEVADWVPGSWGWLYIPDDDGISVDPAPNNQPLAVRIGERTLVADSRIWRIKRTFPADRDRPAPVELEFTIKLAILVSYQDGSVIAAKILARDGIWEQRPGAAGPAVPAQPQSGAAAESKDLVS